LRFVADATGSMGDEIQYLQEELQDVIGGLSGKTEASIFTLVLSFYRITMMSILPVICSLEGMGRL